MRKWSISLVATAALSIAALLAPSAASAATCPPGQTGTPPYCVTPTPPPTPPPSEEVTVFEVEHSNSGVVNLTLFFTKPGNLSVSGKAIKGLQLTVNSAGAVTVTLQLNLSDVRQHFNRQGWTRPKRVVVTFTATDGTVTTKKLGIVFKKKNQ